MHTSTLFMVALASLMVNFSNASRIYTKDGSIISAQAMKGSMGALLYKRADDAEDDEESWGTEEQSWDVEESEDSEEQSWDAENTEESALADEDDEEATEEGEDEEALADEDDEEDTEEGEDEEALADNDDEEDTEEGEDEENDDEEALEDNDDEEDTEEGEEEVEEEMMKTTKPMSKGMKMNSRGNTEATAASVTGNRGSSSGSGDLLAGIPLIGSIVGGGSSSSGGLGNGLI